MPLDFPASPTDGQIYENWVYSTAKGAWKAKPLTPGQAQISATAPANPNSGDQWYNSIDGVLYIYYNDGNTSQWVESRSAITSDGYYSPNYIINGGFDIWQRGTSSTTATAGYYTADRFATYITGSGTFQQDITYVAPYASNGLRFTSSAASTAGYMYYTVETKDAIKMAGKTVTFSSYLTASASKGIRIEIRYSTATDNPFNGTWTSIIVANRTATTTMGRYSVTADIPSTAKTIQVNISNASSFASTEFFSISGVQLEEGPVATPFRRNANSIQGELAACKRYYFEWTGGQYISRGPVGGCSTVNTFLVGIPISMRIVPALGSRTANVGVWNPSGPGVVGGGTTSINGLYSTADNVYVQYVHGTNVFTAGTIGMLNTTNAGGWIIAFDAEL